MKNIKFNLMTFNSYSFKQNLIEIFIHKKQLLFFISFYVLFSVNAQNLSVCEGVKIMGDEVLCVSKQYSVQSSIHGDASVTWSVNNKKVVSLSNTTGVSTTLTTPVNSYTTNVVLTATISSVSCQCMVSISKTIWVGKPDSPAYLNGPTRVIQDRLEVYKMSGVANVKMATSNLTDDPIYPGTKVKLQFIKFNQYEEL